MVRERSRLIRTQAKQTKKQIILFSIAIVATIFVFLNFGPAIITSIGSTLSGKKNTYIAPTSKNILDAPAINQPFSATDSAKITVSGSTGYQDAHVELFVNDASFDITDVKGNGTFSFDNVALQNGDNNITAKVEKGTDTSDYSEVYSVKLLKADAPKLDVSFPQDNATLQKGDQEINVTGSTDTDNTVTVNNFRAIVDDAGNFSYYLKLNEGDNTLTIVATNPAGRSTTRTLKVNYKP